MRRDVDIAAYLGCQANFVAQVRAKHAKAATVRAASKLVGTTPDEAPLIRIATRTLRDRMLAAYRLKARRDGTNTTGAMLDCMFGPGAGARFTTATKEGTHS